MGWKSILFISLLTFSYAQETPKMLHAHSIEVKYTAMDGSVKEVTVARDSDLRCRDIPFDGKTFWSEEYPLKTVPEFCKKSFITTAGQLSPMKIDEKIDTYGELEVLEFLDEMQEDQNMLFVDSRKKEWYEARTIPGSHNIPFIYFTEKGKWEKKKQEALTLLGIKITKEGYDFSEAKTVLFFCNGVWCRQSPQMIEALLEMGYPPEKMKWYRGGLQSWLNVGMTSIIP
ncbi:rhodanese-like domain-containing protein [Sulfurovum sp. zt1-1]|uniref:Rhodanese-like domain-containing protein n=1 Tax=Sulfurovum zhangzhouensis TaxID=3019067 RepID=A0ABT7R0W0_9BACT|nr:rhodanese-like domain-containing protein [Sulfurovum zhangzhouensis]MDM5272136.1 rhodanese-like domain-containing protein [Sulfurovum zhangzhouensis]